MMIDIPRYQKEKAKKKRYIAYGILIVFLIIMLAYIIEHPADKIKTCVYITEPRCDLDTYGVYAHGYVKNVCETKLTMIEITAKVYSDDGKLLAEAPAYLVNLQPGELYWYKVIMDKPASEVRRCTAEVTGGY